MDIVDREILEAERDAGSPHHYSPAPDHGQHQQQGAGPHRRSSTNQSYLPRHSHEIERVPTAGSSTSTSSSSSVGSTPAPGGGGGRSRTHERRRPSAASNYTMRTVPMSRVSTQPDVGLTGTLSRHPTEISRIATHRSQHTATVGRTRSCRTRYDDQEPLPPFGAGKPYPPPLPEREEYVVEFDGPDDPAHPHNWPLKRKLLTAAQLAYTTMVSVFASSIYSPAIPVLSRHYGVSPTVSTLGVSAFVLGFAFGPTFWAPLSELRGRRLPLLISMAGFSLFSLATATAKDVQTIIVTRFFAGLFGSSPLAVVAAVFSDMFDNRTRGVAITVFAMCVFAGPFFAPFVGGYIVENPDLGWRFTEYLVSILGAVALVVDSLFLRETYPPVVLVEKAADLRRRTRNWGIHAKQEEIEVELGDLLRKNFARPLRLLFREPIVLLISIYMAFIYGLLYLFLTAYPAVFQRVHGFGVGASGLPFFGMVLGQLLAGGVVLAQQPWYERKLAANNDVAVPEWRLPSIIAGGVSFAAGIFWFGWTGYRADIHWMVPTASGVLTGFGLMSIFLQAMNYIVDSYLMFAASALAGNTFLRSLCGAGFPLFASRLFEGLGINYAATLLGGIAVLLIPIPVLFYLYGHRLRAKSSFAKTLDLDMDSSYDSIDEEKSIASGVARPQGPLFERPATRDSAKSE